MLLPFEAMFTHYFIEMLALFIFYSFCSILISIYKTQYYTPYYYYILITYHIINVVILQLIFILSCVKTFRLYYTVRC